MLFEFEKVPQISKQFPTSTREIPIAVNNLNTRTINNPHVRKRNCSFHVDSYCFVFSFSRLETVIQLMQKSKTVNLNN